MSVGNYASELETFEFPNLRHPLTSTNNPTVQHDPLSPPFPHMYHRKNSEDVDLYAIRFLSALLR